MSTTIKTRETAGTGATVKGSTLTNAELDTNFIKLNEAVQPAGGTTGQILSKIDGTDFNSQWRALIASDVPTLNQNTTGSAAKLTTPRAIAGVNFDGSAPIAIPVANLSDVAVTTPTNNQLLAYNSTTGKWTNTSDITGTFTSGTWNATIIGATYGGTGVNNGSSTITLGGSLTTSGAFATTFTTTNTTNVTLPTTGTLSTLAGAETLTNKRIDPRVSSATSAASVTPTVASFDIYAFTAQAVALTINAPTGTPLDGDKLIFRILDNGTPQTLTWNATYTVIGTTLPTTTTANKMLYVGCIYNTANTRWDVIAVTTQA